MNKQKEKEYEKEEEEPDFEWGQEYGFKPSKGERHV